MPDKDVAHINGKYLLIAAIIGLLGTVLGPIAMYYYGPKDKTIVIVEKEPDESESSPNSGQSDVNVVTIDYHSRPSNALFIMDETDGSTSRRRVSDTREDTSWFTLHVLNSSDSDFVVEQIKFVPVTVTNLLEGIESSRIIKTLTGFGYDLPVTDNVIESPSFEVGVTYQARSSITLPAKTVTAIEMRLQLDTAGEMWKKPINVSGLVTLLRNDGRTVRATVEVKFREDAQDIQNVRPLKGTNHVLEVAPT